MEPNTESNFVLLTFLVNLLNIWVELYLLKRKQVSQLTMFSFARISGIWMHYRATRYRPMGPRANGEPMPEPYHFSVTGLSQK